MKKAAHKIVLVLIVISLLSFVYSCGAIRFHVGESDLDRTFDYVTADGDLSESDIMALQEARITDLENAAMTAALLKGFKGAATGDWLGTVEKIAGAALGLGAAGMATHKITKRSINRERDAARKARGEPVTVKPA